MFEPKFVHRRDKEFVLADYTWARNNGFVYRTRVGYALMATLNFMFEEFPTKEDWEEDSVDAALGLLDSGVRTLVGPVLVPINYIRSYFDLEKIDEPKRNPAPVV